MGIIVVVVSRLGMGISSMNSTLEVVEFAGEIGRDGSSGEVIKRGRGEKERRRRRVWENSGCDCRMGGIGFYHRGCRRTWRRRNLI